MEFQDHFSDQSDDYQRYRPQYPQTLFQWLASVTPAHSLAWDCATGNGQAAQRLAQYFDQVIATDGSRQQIQHAPPIKNIRYVVTAETCDKLATSSVDLITVAQALHWLDTVKFFYEVERVLRPGGILAVWCYNLPSINPDIDVLVSDFYHHVVGKYWPVERYLLEEGYQLIPLPYPSISAPNFAMSHSWQRENFIGYLSTWSAVKRYRQDKHQNPLVTLSTALNKQWPNDLFLDVYWPLTVKATNKPLSAS